MTRLGYTRLGVQGGDTGGEVSPEVGRVSSEVGRAAPDRVIGVRVNGTAAFVMPDSVDEQTRDELTDLENDRMGRVGQFMQQEYGYIAIQSTRPQILACGLVDSPVGQPAWLIDKFRDAGIDDDRLLTNAMFFWLTGIAGTTAYVGYHSDASAGGTATSPPGAPVASLQSAHGLFVDPCPCLRRSRLADPPTGCDGLTRSVLPGHEEVVLPRLIADRPGQSCRLRHRERTRRDASVTGAPTGIRRLSRPGAGGHRTPVRCYSPPSRFEVVVRRGVAELLHAGVLAPFMPSGGLRALLPVNGSRRNSSAVRAQRPSP
jgi:hypothetical protein